MYPEAFILAWVLMGSQAGKRGGGGGGEGADGGGLASGDLVVTRSYKAKQG